MAGETVDVLLNRMPPVCLRSRGGILADLASHFLKNRFNVSGGVEIAFMSTVCHFAARILD